MKLHNEKVKLAVYIVIVTASIYLCVKYLLPLGFPFIAAYAVSLLINPVAEWLHNKLNFQKKIAVIMVMIFYIILTVTLGGWLVQKICFQIEKLVSNFPTLQSAVWIKAKGICNQIEHTTGLKDGMIYTALCECINNFCNDMQSKIMSSIMGNSVPVIVETVECIAVIIIVVVGAFFFAIDRENIRKWCREFVFADEFGIVAGKLRHVFVAYVRAQLVIMLFTAIICTIGLWVIGNPYSIILGIVIGILDAMPLIGAGIILIPWAIFYLISGSVKKGIIIFIVFVICYVTREVLEPKLIGNDIGMHPLVSLISIYVGYKAFGVLGVVLGPIAYVVIVEVVKGLTKNN